jgi:hypothetical protein
MASASRWRKAGSFARAKLPASTAASSALGSRCRFRPASSASDFAFIIALLFDGMPGALLFDGMPGASYLSIGRIIFTEAYSFTTLPITRRSSSMLFAYLRHRSISSLWQLRAVARGTMAGRPIQQFRDERLQLAALRNLDRADVRSGSIVRFCHIFGMSDYPPIASRKTTAKFRVRKQSLVTSAIVNEGERQNGAA